MFNKIKSQKGVSLFLALVIMTIFLAMGLGLTAISLSQKKVIRGIDYSVSAVAAADTGVEGMLYLDKNCASSTYCNNNTDICNDPACSGVESGYNLSGSLSNTEADYDVTFFRNCGLNTIKSTGGYKEVKRAFEISFGYSLAGIYLNSYSDESCHDKCVAIDCAGERIGTDFPSLSDSKYYYYDGAECASTTGSTSTVMGSAPPAGGQDCGYNGYIYTTMWSFCKCKALQ